MHVQVASMSYQDLIRSFDRVWQMTCTMHLRLAGYRHSIQRRFPHCSPVAPAGRRPFSTIVQHFRGMAAQIPPDSTAFGLRREHLMVEIIASWDPSGDDDGSAHKRWARHLSQTLAPV
jgi:hypothetical protein